MEHFYAFKANHQLLRRGWLALAGLLIGGPAALAQPTSYCTSNLGAYCGTGNANINAVAIANTPLNNPNTTCNTVNGSGYTLWPTAGATTATLLRGLGYSVSVMTPESGIISVWFDWNQNGQFEASEWTQVATASTAGQPASITVTVPTTATLGLTGMRVRSRLVNNQNGAGDACLNFGSGETEDYTVTIGPEPACAPPNTLGAGSITTTGATLTFSGASNGAATGYIVQYGPAGFTPGGTGSTTVNATGTSVPVTGLTANTSYQFYVTKDCGGGQTSIQAGPFTFRTACVTASYAPLPATQDFENTWLDVCNTHDAPGSAWRNLVTTGNTSWRREDDAASAAWTSPTIGAYTPAGSVGSHSARFHSYTAGAGGTGALDLYVDLSGAGFKRLTFDYINTAGNDSLFVEVSTDGGSTFGAPVGRYGISGTVAEAWRSQALNINTVSATAIVRFRTKVTTTFTSDIGLDNVRLELGSGCLTPANLTATGITQNGATLNWLNSGNGTYTVVYGPTGFNPATGGTTVSGITGTSTTITGLTGSTNYQFYVTQNCAGGTNSGQAGPFSFATSIVNDDCAGAIDVPIQYGTTCIGQTSADNTFATASANVPAPGCASYVGQDIWFKVTVPASGQLVIQTLPPTAGSSITDTGMAIYSGACGSLTLVECDDDDSPNGLFSLVTLTGRTPGEVLYIRAWEFGGNVSGLIAVCVTSPSNCPLPTGPAAANLTNTTADLSFTPGGTVNPGDTFEVEYGLAGFTQGSGTMVNSIPSPSYQLTGLQPDTEYCFYVRQNCGPTNGSSPWVGPTCFRTPLTVPNNDEPCGALPLASGSAVGSTTIGATTSLQNGISLPACSPAASPKDVWFVFTLGANATSTTLNLAGTAAGMVRLFTSPDCTNGPFVQVGCEAAATNNAGFPNPVTFSGLVPGQRYWLAVSGFGSSDVSGAFTVSATNAVLGARAAAAASALSVYPNPSGTGELTLRVGGARGAGEAALVNTLGQVVRRVAVAAGSSEQRVSTRGLAAGVYTLRLTVGQQASATKVVLQ